MTEKAFVIRNCNADFTSHNGFKWPAKGFVEAPDWNPAPVCGGGLHGLLDGIGEYGLLSSAHDAIWQIVEVDRAGCVQIDSSKVKLKCGEVVYSGGMAGALTRISKEWIRIALADKNGAVTKKDSHHAATTGYGANAATTGNGANASAKGKGSTAACLGLNGQARAGENGAIVVSYWDKKSERVRVRVGYVGESGIEADAWYRVTGEGEFEKVPGEAG